VQELWNNLPKPSVLVWKSRCGKRGPGRGCTCLAGGKV